MNGLNGDGDLKDENTEKTSDATLEDSSAKQVEDVLQGLIETTDNSISNSWTILSTEDENNSEGETVANVNEASYNIDVQNTSLPSVQQSLDTNHCLVSGDEKAHLDSSLPNDGIVDKDDNANETSKISVIEDENHFEEAEDKTEVDNVKSNMLYGDKCNKDNAPKDLLDEVVASDVCDNLDHESSSSDELKTKTDQKVEHSVTEDEEKTEEVKDEWLDILGNKLLMKKVVTKGLGPDFRAQRGQECHIFLQTFLSDGKHIDDRHKEVFILGDNDLTSAIDLSVNLMEKGEVSKVISDAKYCYGENGRLPDIPPNTNIEYEIELIDLHSGPYDTETAVEKRLTWVDLKRNQGNQLYREKKFIEAISAYTKCARVIEQASHQAHPDEIRTNITQLNIKCQNNLSAAYMMLERWKEALQACNTVTAIEPKNIRALFRKGKVLAETGELKSAVLHLKKAAQLSPNDKTIQSEITKQSNRLKVQKETQKKMYQRMFGGPAVDKKSKDNEDSSESWLPSTSTSVIVGVCAVAVFAIAGYFTAR